MIFKVILIIWNMIVLGMYAIDKYKAATNRRRIPEANMIASTLFLGGAGAALGMIIFNHKTHKIYFKTAAAAGVMIFAFFTWYLIAYI